MDKNLLFRFSLFLLILPCVSISFAQSSCDPITPSFTVNLSSNPNGTWISSPPTVRDGNCCGTTAPDKCIEFVITLAPTAIAINFGIASGAIPPGAMFYQVNCGPPISVGTPICLNGPGPYWLTFCKPGNNTNTYQITSIGPPEGSPDDSTGNGCSAKLYASGLLEDSTLVWNSIYPGAIGAYNSFLNCTTGCDTVQVTPDQNSPPYIDYMVCGYPSAAGCASSSTWCDTMRVYVSPPLKVSVNPNPASFCVNAGSVHLTGTASGGVPPYATAWFSGSNATGSVVATGNSYTATSPGNYSYVVYDQNYPKCPPTFVNVPVTVIPSPKAGFNANDVCLGATTNFTDASIVCSGPITTWNWNFGDSTACSTQQSPTHTYSAYGTYSVILTVTSTDGCIGSDTLNVSVHPGPVASFTAPSVCFGAATSFHDLSATSSGSSNTYSWDFGNFSQINHSQDPNYVYASPGIFNVTFTVNSSFGCTSVATNTVQVYEPPHVSFFSVNACVDSTTFFTDQSWAGNSEVITNWTWAFGDGSPTVSIQDPSHTFSQSGTFNVSLVATTAHGCKDTVTKPVTIYPTPSVNFAVKDTSTCINVCSNFFDGSTITNSSIANWRWDFGDGNTSTQKDPVHCYNKTGSFSISLTVTSGNGCVATQQIPNYVHVWPAPTAAFTYWPQPIDPVDPTVTFKDLSDNSVIAWNWDLGDNSTSTSQFPTHLYSDSGTFCATLIVENIHRCKDTTVHCLRVDPDFAFYIPNAFSPLSSKGTNDVFSPKGIYTNKYQMWIYDRWGNQIFHTQDINTGWDGHVNNSDEVVQEDTYVYKIEVCDPAGDMHHYAGVVNLIK